MQMDATPEGETMKVATVFYYADVNDRRYSHLRPDHVERCLISLGNCGIEAILIRDDGSQPWLRPHDYGADEGIPVGVVTELYNSPRRIGINQGMLMMADKVNDDDLVLHVDPHEIFYPDKMQEVYKAFQDEPELQCLMLGLIPGRIARGTWAAYRSDYVDNKIGVMLSMMCRGTLYKRYAAEYLSKLKPTDMSWPMSHFERWILTVWPDEAERKKHFREWKGIVGKHDDDLDFWQHLESIYNNGRKAGETDLKGLPPQRQLAVKTLRSKNIADCFNTLEAMLWRLGASEALWHIDDKMNYSDCYFVGEDCDPRAATERPWMAAIDKWTIGSVLDVGCGNGLFGLYVWSMRPHVHDERKGKAYNHGGEPHSAILGLPHYFGIDTCRIAIEKARKANQETAKLLTFSVGDLFEEKSEDAYDTVIASEFLEHIPDERRQEAVDIMRRLCRHRVIATVPNQEMSQGDHYKGFFTEQELRELFKAFLRVEVEYADQLRWIVIGHKREVP